MKSVFLLFTFLAPTAIFAAPIPVGGASECAQSASECPQEQVALCECRNFIAQSCAEKCGLPPPAVETCGAGVSS
jgi:hypothetical protein